MHVEPCTRCGLFHPAGVPCLAPRLAVGAGGALWALPAGALLAGRYLIIEAIHRGGMSTVYLAEDTLLHARQVAIKELRLAPDAGVEETQEAEAWFARESALFSVLRHSLIPAFFSVFRENGRSYIAQEYVPGENLDELVRREGPLPEDLVIGWGVSLCGLLDYLHSLLEPVIFRDLKPANVLLRSTWSAPDRRLAVVDFGIARTFQQGRVGTVIGTPGYAPPEQYQGLATPQSDIYALGATLHRLLTGYDPEHGTPFTFPRVDMLNPLVSPELAAIVARAVALNPAERYASAAEMEYALRDLRLMQDGTPLVAPAPSTKRALGWAALVLLVPLVLAQAFKPMAQPNPPATQWVIAPDQTGGQFTMVTITGPGDPGDQDNAPFFAPASGDGDDGDGGPWHQGLGHGHGHGFGHAKWSPQPVDGQSP